MLVSFFSPCRKATIWISHSLSLLFSFIKLFYPILSGVEKRCSKATHPASLGCTNDRGLSQQLSGSSACQPNAIS
jgi:hypothetical protein